MKRSTLSTMLDKLDIPPLANQIWKNARAEIIFRALRDLPQDLQKKFNISDEQFKRLRNSGTVPQDLLVRLSKICQNNKDMQGLMMSLAYASMVEDEPEQEAEGTPPWESLFRLLLLSLQLDFEHPWLQSEKEAEKFLKSGDAEIQKRCDLATVLLRASSGVENIGRNSQEKFYKNINFQLAALADKVENAEQYEKLQEGLVKIARERRAYLKGARSLRLVLRKLLHDCTELKLQGDISSGGIWDFIKALNLNFDEWFVALREAAAAVLPRLFDAMQIRKRLDLVMPPLSKRDFDLMLEELGEIEEDRLSPDDSQLTGNILPALLGERAFDMDAFENAMDKGQAKDYSHKFICHLAAGHYLIPQEDEEEEESKAEEAVPEESAAFAGEESVTAVAAEQSGQLFEESVKETGTESSEEMLEDVAERLAYASGVDSGEAEAAEEAEVFMEPGPEEEPESPPRQARNAETDGFEFMEDELSVPPQPDEGFAKSQPESMTIEQACSIAELESAEEGGMPVIDEDTEEALEDLSVADPLERKFLKKKRQEGQGNTDPCSSRTCPSGAFQDFAPKGKAAEKKSPEFREEKRLKAVPDAEQKLAFRKFIHALEHAKGRGGLSEMLENQRAVLDSFLDQGELEAFFRLCKRQEGASPCPEALAELLYLGTQYMPGQEEPAARILELIAHIIAESERYADGENLLLGAAILRPALMIPHEHIRAIISILSGKLAHYGLSSFFNALERFISQRIALDPSIFTGQNEERLREIRVESLLQETEDFLRRMRNSRTSFQPASQLRKRLYGPTGQLGSLLESCLRGEAADLSGFLAANGDEKGMEKIIDTNDNPHRTKPIEASARKRLMQEIRQAMKLLSDWRDYFERSALPANRTYSLDKFHELFDNPGIDIERLGGRAEGRILVEQIRELSECPKKSLSSKSNRPLRDLRLWPLRIPYMDPLTKRINDPASLVSTVLQKRHVDDNFVAASLVTHLGGGSLTWCHEFLEAYPLLKDIEPDMSAFAELGLAGKGISTEKYQAIADLVWEDMFRELVEDVKNDIVACEFRGILHTHQPARYLNQLDAVIQNVEESGAKADGVAKLEEIRQDLKKMEEQGLEEILEKIGDLKQRPDLSPECKERLDLIRERRLKDKMLNLAWNELAEITDHLAKGLPLNDLPAEADPADNVAHAFFRLLEDGAVGGRAGEASRIWNAAANSLRERVNNGRLGATVTRAMADFMRWLGFTLDQRQQPEVRHSSPAPNFWRVIALKMEIPGPLPQWSKRKTRHLAAFGWNVRPENINQLLQANFMDNEDCKTIICFNKLDFEARQKLMALCGQRKIAPLIVDENLFNFLSQFDNPARTEALFRIGLAGAGIIPYVDVGGAVPKEMFFGRQDDIRALLDPMGPCIVYGGRQLGKSALLQQIHNNDNERSGIKTVLHSMSNSESSLLDAIRNGCVEAGILHSAVQKKNLSANIKKWLDENPEWRILVLLDECDRVLDLDREKDFAEISELRNLMNDTERRFKVVITGLHSVQRFSQITNQPFLHFGDPLCIGPLSSSAAYELMTGPMSMLGVEFANSQLVQVALNHCSYQPKLIQIFCMELLKGLFNGRKVPFETIDEKGIQKIYGSHNLKKKIVECFDMTLNLDDRYLVIGYVLAINNHLNMDLHDLLGELKYYWPAAFADKKDGGSAETLNTLRSLLHEMEGLGLVTRLDNKYALRSPNVIDLLGGIDQILTKLDPYLQRPYKPVLSLDELRLRDFETLVASQFNRLSEKCNSLHWISGNTALGIDDMASTLKRMVDEENRYKPVNEMKLVKLNGATEHEVFQNLRENYDRLEGGMICWLSASEFAFTDRFMQKARDWLDKLRTGRKFVKIVCVVDPATLHDFISTGHAAKFSDSHIQLMPWSSDGLEQYYKEKAHTGGPGPEMILSESRGWPKLVKRYFSGQASPHPLSASDFWNGDGKLVRDLVDFIAKVLEGRLGKETLEEDAAAMLEMFPAGMIKETDDMLDWIRTLQSLFILRESESQLLLDPIARDAILEVQAQ